MKKYSFVVILFLTISCSKQDWYYPLFRPYVYLSSICAALGLPIFPQLNENAENDYYLMFDNTPGDRYVDGLLEPKRPDYQESISSFDGVDQNENGIRDEVEIWINSNVYSAVGRKFYREFYLYLVPLVKKYSESGKSPPKNYATFDHYDKMYNCLRAIDSHSRDLKSMFFVDVIFNSSTRSDAYQRFWNHHMRGFVTNRVDSRDSCQRLGQDYENAKKWNDENAIILSSHFEKKENGKWKWCIALPWRSKKNSPLYDCEGRRE